MLFRAFYWTFRLELCSSAKGQRLGSTNGVQGRLNVGTTLLLIDLRDVHASIGGTVSTGLKRAPARGSTVTLSQAQRAARKAQHCPFRRCSFILGKCLCLMLNFFRQNVATRHDIYFTRPNFASARFARRRRTVHLRSEIWRSEI